jgi:hypothetical protein
MTFSARGSDEISESKSGDRRVHERRLITPRLYVVLHGSNGDGILNDVSEGGAALELEGPEPEGESLLVDFEMPETGQRFEATGRVTWRDETGKKVGVQFVDLPEASRGLIREWLSIKSISAEPVHSTIVQDAERENSTSLKVEPSAFEESAPVTDRVVQNLLDSFNPANRKSNALTDLSGSYFSARRPLRVLMVVAAALCLAVLLAYRVAACHSPQQNASMTSVSKAGRGSATEPRQRPLDEAGMGSADAGVDSGNGPTGSRLPVPAMLPQLTKTKDLPCVKLGATSDKIRVYLWVENDTPEALARTYEKHLNSVLDVRVVDKAPYDLVLYVNGAKVSANSPSAGFLWSSRVFRPWYCGEVLGLLEETKVNESLHYVQGSNLDQHIQAETAYLILHTLEAMRNERSR